MMTHLTKRLFPVAAIAAFAAGCQSGEVASPFNDRIENRAQLAAFAANADYPDAQPADQRSLGAVVDPDGRISVINFSQEPVGSANVWVNGQYVQFVDGVPANGLIMLKRENLYNDDGDTLAETKEKVSRVEIEAGDKFLALEGPAYRR